MPAPDEFDVAIVGGGPGGIISLYYAQLAGLRAVVLEKEPAAGGLWARLPTWQDIQNRTEDWTLGDIPIGDELHPRSRSITPDGGSARTARWSLTLRNPRRCRSRNSTCEAAYLAPWLGSLIAPGRLCV
jgi:cation diffusion facilitator CzcD-associated flavoprotein CzcO